MLDFYMVFFALSDYVSLFLRVDQGVFEHLVKVVSFNLVIDVNILIEV